MAEVALGRSGVSEHHLSPHTTRTVGTDQPCSSAVLVPAVRAIWKRPQHDSESSNSTEYAFRKSKSLITRILGAVRSSFGGLASVTFFVFAVLYVFQNEVSLRVAKTVSKRLKRLHAKVERGDQEITQADLKLLRGWRWRILL